MLEFIYYMLPSVFTGRRSVEWRGDTSPRCLDLTQMKKSLSGRAGGTEHQVPARPDPLC